MPIPPDIEKTSGEKEACSTSLMRGHTDASSPTHVVWSRFPGWDCGVTQHWGWKCEHPWRLSQNAIAKNHRHWYLIWLQCPYWLFCMPLSLQQWLEVGFNPRTSWQTILSSDAVGSWTSLCLRVGNPPLDSSESDQHWKAFYICTWSAYLGAPSISQSDCIKECLLVENKIIWFQGNRWEPWWSTLLTDDGNLSCSFGERCSTTVFGVNFFSSIC